MKSILLSATLFLSLSNIALAHSVRIRIVNNSNMAFTFDKQEANKGKLCVTDGPSYTNVINPGTSGEYYSEESCGATGVDGFVQYTAVVNGKSYQLFIGFDNPFIGDNGYNPTISYPFFIKHLGGGEGSDVFISYEISGGPVAVPPPPPILLPNTGNRIITGNLTWDETVDGMPELNGLDLAANTFEIVAKAPSSLVRNYEGSGGNTYNGQRGSFAGMQKVGNISFLVSEGQAGGKRTIQYKLTGLPDNLPITISAEPITTWQPGENAPPKPETDNPSSYVVEIDELNKGANSISYKVVGGWVVDFGNGKSGGASSEMQALMSKIKGKTFRPGEDIIFGDAFSRGNLSQKNNLKSQLYKGTALDKKKPEIINSAAAPGKPASTTANQLKVNTQQKANTPVKLNKAVIKQK